MSLSDPASPTPDFTVDVSGTYVVQLIVNDGTVDSVPDMVVINTQNSRPVADAGEDQSVVTGATVQLDGSQSSDVDGDPLTFQWSSTTLPTGSVATWSDPAATYPTFVADVTGMYVVQLIVNDGTEDSLPTSVVVTANTAPMVEAGDNQTVQVNTLVTLDGSGSSEPASDPRTFQWTFTSQPAGSAATLTTPPSVDPTFVPAVIGDHTVEHVANVGPDDIAADPGGLTDEQ